MKGRDARGEREEREREREREREKHLRLYCHCKYNEFQSGQSKAGHPVFYFIARKFP